jgi:hypothetical protein
LSHITILHIQKGNTIFHILSSYPLFISSLHILSSYPLFICSHSYARIQKLLTYSLSSRLSLFRIHHSFYHFIFIILRGCLRFAFLHIHIWGKHCIIYACLILYIHLLSTFIGVNILSSYPLFISSLHILSSYPLFICSLCSHPEMSSIFTYQYLINFRIHFLFIILFLDFLEVVSDLLFHIFYNSYGLIYSLHSYG